MADQPIFLTWFTALYERGAARCVKDAIYLDAFAAKRMAIGVASDKRPVLGLQEPDLEALTNVMWRRAVLVTRYRAHDWIGLTADDITNGVNPTPMKIWIPIDAGTFDAWPWRPKKMYIAGMKARGGKPYPIEQDTPDVVLNVRMKRPEG